MESSKEEHQNQANELLELVVKMKPVERTSFRIGVAGPPGAGKSAI